MKKSHDMTATFLLIAAMLLTGCSEISNSSNPTADTSSAPQPESSPQSSIIESTQSRTETVSSAESSSTSSPQSRPESVVVTPVEYTDEDRELQKILLDLKIPTEDILNCLVNMAPNPALDFRFPQFDNEYILHFGLIPENYRICYDLFDKPTTRDDLEKLLLEYFSAEFTKRHMDDAPVCTMTEKPDGTYTVTLTNGIEHFADGHYPHLVEINGRLYQCEGLKPGSLNMDCETAKIISKTDDTIKFSYLNDVGFDYDQYFFNGNYKNEPYYSQNATGGTLKYERGGWKLNSFNDYGRGKNE